MGFTRWEWGAVLLFRAKFYSPLLPIGAVCEIDGLIRLFSSSPVTRQYEKEGDHVQTVKGSFARQGGLPRTLPLGTGVCPASPGWDAVAPHGMTGQREKPCFGG